jgi:hypothetical protein
MAEMSTSQKAVMRLAAIEQVKLAYMKWGFNVTHILLDGQFEPLCGDVAGLGISLTVVSRDEHVPEIEWYIRTIKEHTPCVYNMLPFKKMPSCIIIEMVYASIFWLNIPSKA